MNFNMQGALLLMQGKVLTIDMTTIKKCHDCFLVVSKYGRVCKQSLASKAQTKDTHSLERILHSNKKSIFRRRTRKNTLKTDETRSHQPVSYAVTV